MSLARRAPTLRASRVETDRYDKREAGPGRGHIIDDVERLANMPPIIRRPIFPGPPNFLVIIRSPKPLVDAEVPYGAARVRQEASVMGAHYGRIRTGPPSASPAVASGSFWARKPAESAEIRAQKGKPAI